MTGMTPEQMQARSQAKVKQVMDLCEVLQITVRARIRQDQSGFIDPVVFWTDEEKYQPAEPAAPTGGTQAAPEAPAPVEPAV